MDESSAEPPRRYQLRPFRLVQGVGSVLLAGVLAGALLVAFTPLRALLPGPSSEEVRHRAHRNAVRLAALKDSMQARQHYVSRLRRIMSGKFDSAAVAPSVSAPPVPGSGVRVEPAAVPSSEDWRDHAQPALPVTRLPVQPVTSSPVLGPNVPASAPPRFPAKPPVEGFVTRGFDARAGHYALDIAVEEGTPVRAIADGYVILANWLQNGGGVIAIQHAGGYISIYKHNQRLLTHVGDRVRARDVIAYSGNTGEITTGPHLHVELWHNGLAQDPRLFFVGE